jgi:hypothetical protein
MIDPKTYGLLAQCIRSGQLSAKQVQAALADKAFAAWYLKEFGHGLY